jgi:acetylornithine deacetylase/succinyl-diaminopimelate desuccinylase-like protein
MKSYVYILCALGAIGVFLIVDPPTIFRAYSQTALYNAPLILMAALCFGAALALGMPPKSAPKTKPVAIPVEPVASVDKRSVDDKRGKGRPKSACELAKKGLIQCPLIEVDPEIPESTINVIADKVSQKVALRMLTALDPQRAQTIQEERKKVAPSPQPPPQPEKQTELEKPEKETQPEKSGRLIEALAEIAEEEVTPT